MNLKDAYLEAGGIEGDEKEGGWKRVLGMGGRGECRAMGGREREREIWMVEDG